MIYKAQSSHIGSNFSCIDILTVLYSIINLDKELKEDRDRVIFSKGWAAASAYYFLADKGVISHEGLDSYGDSDTGMFGLVERGVRGIEASTGSMGHGLPIGVGIALASKRSSSPFTTYVLMSDGEMDCGTTWESALLASHHKLDNLVVIVDYNKLQAMGEKRDILNIEPLFDKWRAFGWSVSKTDGHNHENLEIDLNAAGKNSTHLASIYYEPGKPRVLICNTTKGKGVSFMENNNLWHYKNISDEEYQLACEELSSNN